MAPELLKEWNSGGLLPSTDMYSLGMVILRLLVHLDVGESEMLRINNRLRKAPKDEIITLFRCDSFISVPTYISQYSYMCQT